MRLICFRGGTRFSSKELPDASVLKRFDVVWPWDCAIVPFTSNFNLPRLGSVMESHKVKLLGKGAYGIAWAWYRLMLHQAREWWSDLTFFRKVWKVKDKESSRTSLSVCRLMTPIQVQYRRWLLIMDDYCAIKLCHFFSPARTGEGRSGAFRNCQDTR